MKNVLKIVLSFICCFVLYVAITLIFWDDVDIPRTLLSALIFDVLFHITSFLTNKKKQK